MFRSHFRFRSHFPCPQLRRTALIVGTFALILGAGVSSAEQPTVLPVGQESQVNSYTTGEQGRPAVAGDADGGFVVAWESDGAEDTAVRSILARRFDASGQALATEFRASFSTASDNTDPDVAVGPGGEFTVVWKGPNYIGSATAGQRYDSAGDAVGGVLFISESTVDNTGPPAVAYLPDGGFVVTWTKIRSGPVGPEVLARRYDSAGQAGGIFQVNSFTTGIQEAPRVAAFGSGDFAIVYESAEFPGQTFRSVVGQRFDSTGQPLGEEWALAGSIEGSSGSADIAALGEGFALTWIGPGFVGSTLYARAFNAAGTPRGETFAPTGTISNARHPRIEVGADGQAMLAWDEQDSSGDEDGRSVHGRAIEFKDSTVTLGGSLQINVTTGGDQVEPAVAAAGDAFIVVWDSETSAGSDTDLGSVQSRRLAMPIFYDGFESGTLGAWSTSLP